jgi:hypothetical protein
VASKSEKISLSGVLEDPRELSEDANLFKNKKQRRCELKMKSCIASVQQIKEMQG